jgi:hypothetical protein
MKNFDDLLQYNIDFLTGVTKETVYHYGELENETKPFANQLISMHKLGLLTVCSQPGFRVKGPLRQKPFLEFYASKDKMPIVGPLETLGYKVCVVSPHKLIYLSPDQQFPITLTTDKNKPLTLLSSVDSLILNYDHNFGDLSHILKDSYLYFVYYPKFSDKNIFNDILKEINDHSYFEHVKKVLSTEINLIALIGKMGSGKDYIADKCIIPNLDRTLKVAFADLIKIEALSVFNGNPCTIFGQRDFKTRRLLQNIGTDAKKNDPDIWTKKLLSLIYLQYKTNNITSFVVTDCRFENEIKIMYSLGAKLIHILSPNRTNLKMLQEGSIELGNHVSEKTVKIDFPHILLENDNSSIEEITQILINELKL